MADAPLGFQLHALVAFGLFALWPFTRLVHVFSAPLGYLTRPYIVYRSRDDTQLGSHRPRRGLGPGRLRIPPRAPSTPRRGEPMQKESLTALVRHHLETARTARRAVEAPTRCTAGTSTSCARP